MEGKASDGTTESTSVDETLKNYTHLYPSKPSILPWDKFSQWIYCLCVVTFDLELGQAMEMIYPAHVKLTEKEKSSICYMAFPDSNSGCMGNTQFFFRMRQCPVRRSALPVHEKFNKECSVPLQIDFSHFFGFVYFRQVKDKTIPRGYFQKSMVLLTKLPLITLFTEVLAKIAPLYFCSGEPSIESACHDIDQWPSPLLGVQLSLPLMGSILQTRIPSKSDKSHSPSKLTPEALVPLYETIKIPAVHEADLFKCFFPILSHVQLLWELVITAEPIVVMASSPNITCDMVQALICMIWPLRYCCDYRPYFTIHDSEFKEYTTKVQAPPPIILGVTNPFFAKTLQHWPHIIRVGDHQNSASSSISKHKIKRAGNIKALDSKPGLYTRYKPYLNKDKEILKKLYKGIQNQHSHENQSSILRHHLLELTQTFMIPLERYMASLMPLQKNISPHKAAPSPRPFNPDDFLKSLEQSGPQLTTGIKGNWSGLYRRFFRSANFAGWYDSRYKEVSHILEGLHIEAMSNANMLEWIQNKGEIEVIDLVLKLKDKLNAAESGNLSVQRETVEKLHLHVNSIIETLPHDLQGVLK